MRGYDNVFSTGNVVTGKGNIVASRKHSIEVATFLLERYLGLGSGHDGEEALLDDTPPRRGRPRSNWLPAIETPPKFRRPHRRDPAARRRTAGRGRLRRLVSRLDRQSHAAGSGIARRSARPLAV